MSKIKAFFSYAHIDWDSKIDRDALNLLFDELGNQVRAMLGHKGFYVWRDTERLVIGDDWAEVLPREIETADCFVVILSPGWLQSKVCGEEFELFKQHLKSIETDFKNRIFVFKIKDIDNYPFEIAASENSFETQARRKIRFDFLHKFQICKWNEILHLSEAERASEYRTQFREIAEPIKKIHLEKSKRLEKTLNKRATSEKKESEFAVSSKVSSSIDIGCHPLVSGEFYVPTMQMADGSTYTIELKLVVNGNAKVILDKGEIFFTLNKLGLTYSCSSGQILNQIIDFPKVEARSISYRAKKTCIEISSDSALIGDVLAGKGEAGHVRICEVSKVGSLPPTMTGFAAVTQDSIDVDDRRSKHKNCKARNIMKRKTALAKILIEDSGWRFDLAEDFE